MERTKCTCILCSDGRMTGCSVGTLKILIVHVFARYAQNVRINMIPITATGNKW